MAGAGALGLSIALSLADAGLAVQVFDPAPAGQNASGVAAGMLAPVFEALLDPRAAPDLDLLLAARDLWPVLAQRAGITLDRTGALALGEADELAALEARAAACGLDLQRLAPAEVAALAPAVAAGPALLASGDWRIDAAQAVAALRAAAGAAGVDFRQARCDGSEDADLWVVATGPERGLAGLAPELSALSPIKGHILRAPGVAYAGAVVRCGGTYLAPSERGLVIGATMEAGRADLVVDPARVEGLLAAGVRLFPALRGADVVAETGVRAATADGLPMVGRAARPGVLLAAGARRNGWLLAPLAAAMITAYATDADPGPWAGRLEPGRFDAG